MAAVLFTDVVGYSKLSNDMQRAAAQGLNEQALMFLMPEFRTQRLRPEREPIVTAMPTGDGLVVCLRNSPRMRNDGVALLQLALRLQEWAKASHVALRTGIHSGDLEVIEDVNQQRNFCGHAINIAQRVMDCGNEHHILCSEDAFNSYFRTQPPDSPKNLKIDQLSPLYPIKHGLHVRLYNIFVPNSDGKGAAWGNDEAPPVRLVYQHKPRRPEVFATALHDAKKLMIVGVINDRVMDSLSSIVEKNPGLMRLDVFYAKASTLELVPPEECVADLKAEDYPMRVRSFDDRMKRREESIQRFKELKVSKPVRVKLYEYSMPPLAGIFAGDHDQEHGVIQVNHYIWGRAAAWCPAMILERGISPDEIYASYSEYLAFLASRSSEIG